MICRRALPFVLCLCLLACGGSSRTVLTAVAGLLPEIASLRVMVQLDGKPANEALEFTANLDQFALRLPGSAAGLLQVDVDALDKDRCVAARGKGQRTLEGERTATLAIVLSRVMPRMCP
jgi:hypothetical protein